MKRKRAAALKDLGDTTLRIEHLLNQASRVLNARGVSDYAVADIAKSLRISRSALYYYVEDRENLVFQCYRRSYETIARHLSEAVRVTHNAADAIRVFVERMLDPAHPEIASRAEIACLSPERHAIIQGLHDAAVGSLAHVLETGIKSGTLRECDVDVAAATILSIVAWAPIARHSTEIGKTFSSERVIETIQVTILTGLCTDRSKAPNYKSIDLAPLAPRVDRNLSKEVIDMVKRDTLLAIASRLFTRKGMDSTSIDEVAQRAGVSKRTIYNQIGDKEALLTACHLRGVKIVNYVKDQMLQYDGPPAEALAAAYDAIARTYLDDDMTTIFPMTGFKPSSTLARARIFSGLTELGAGYFRIMAAGVKDGSLVDMDIPARQVMIVGAFAWLSQVDVDNTDRRREHIAREVSHFLCQGVVKH
jgi:AcrR family transcriptional regulator